MADTGSGPELEESSAPPTAVLESSDVVVQSTGEHSLDNEPDASRTSDGKRQDDGKEDSVAAPPADVDSAAGVVSKEPESSPIESARTQKEEAPEATPAPPAKVYAYNDQGEMVDESGRLVPRWEREKELLRIREEEERRRLAMTPAEMVGEFGKSVYGFFGSKKKFYDHLSGKRKRRLRETALHCFFVAVFSLAILLVRDTHEAHFFIRNLREEIVGGVVPCRSSVLTYQGNQYGICSESKDFYGVNTVPDMWVWITTSFLTKLYPSDFNGNISSHQMWDTSFLLKPVTIRQVRSSGYECGDQIPEMLRYDAAVVAEREALDAELNKPYNMTGLASPCALRNTCARRVPYRERLPMIKDCYPSYSQWNREDDPDLYTSAWAGLPWSHESRSRRSTVHSRLNKNYGNGGYTLTLGETLREALDTCAEAERQNWIDTKHTRAVMLEIFAYNPNINQVLALSLQWEISASGSFVPYDNFRAVNLYRWGRSRSIAGLVFSMLTFGIVLFLIGLETTRFIIKAKRYPLSELNAEQLMDCLDELRVKYDTDYEDELRSLLETQLTKREMKLNQLDSVTTWMGVKRYIYDIYNVITVLNLVLFFVVIVLELWLTGFASEWAQGKGVDLEWLVFWQTQAVNINAFNAMLTWLKTLKYVDVLSRKTTQLVETLKCASPGISVLMFLFIIMFLGFGIAFLMTFGQDIEDFATLPSALFALFRALLGDIDYDSMARSNRVLTPVLVGTYVILVTLVMLNMFLAVILSAYDMIKDDLDKKPSLVPDDLRNRFLAGARKVLGRAGVDLNSMSTREKRDRTLSFDEMIGIYEEGKEAFVAMGIKSVGELVEVADANLDGTVSFDEIEAFMRVQERREAEKMQKAMLSKIGGHKDLIKAIENDVLETREMLDVSLGQLKEVRSEHKAGRRTFKMMAHRAPASLFAIAKKTPREDDAFDGLGPVHS